MKELNGWLNLYKEKGITSHDLVYKVRRALKYKKVGHAGTLDPMATGVMVIALGKTTRLIRFLEEVKTYRAEIYFGIRTDTLDAEGTVIEEKELNFSEEELYPLLKKYTGKIEQIPPMVSAISHNGVRLYKLARQGIEVERKAREVEIYELKILEINLPKIIIEVNCQSGTYIRTLADDIGRDLGCGAHLSGLERISSNRYFNLPDAKNVSEISSDSVIDPEIPLLSMDKIILNQEQELKYLQGQKIAVETGSTNLFRVKNSENNLLGIGFAEQGFLKAKVNFQGIS